MMGLLNYAQPILVTAIEKKFVLTVVSTRIGPVMHIVHAHTYAEDNVMLIY
jgi:hypothetical protein